MWLLEARASPHGVDMHAARTETREQVDSAHPWELTNLLLLNCTSTRLLAEALAGGLGNQRRSEVFYGSFCKAVTTAQMQAIRR
jgi:hypothetical protein